MRVGFCHKNVKLYFCVAVSILAVLLSICLPFVATVNACDKVVVIDAGHGGIDVGVVGVRTGVHESDLNLKITKLLGECLLMNGYKVVYTRTTDTMHTYPGVIGNRKRADMFKRRDIINDARPCAVVSIHMNFYSSSSRRGAQVFFDRKSEKGRAFAIIMQSHLNESVNSIGNGRNYSPLSAEKFLLSCTQYPTIIVECGFLSNPFDEQNLCSENYQMLLAQTICQGIKEFCND